MTKTKKIKFIFIFFLVLIIFVLILLQINGQTSHLNPGGEVSNNPKNLVLSLALLADVHNSWDNLSQAIGKVNGQNYSLALFLGDLTDLGSPIDLKKAETIFNSLKIPLYAIPGNHDVWYSRQQGQKADNFFNQSFDSPICVQENGFQLVLVDNADEKNGIDKVELQEIAGCLQTDLPIFVFAHEPLYHPVSDYVMGKYSDSVATQAAQLLQTLCDKKVKLLTAAHQHSFSKYFYSCLNGYQLPMIVSGALTAERNFQSPRFLKLNIYDDASFREKEIILEKK